MNLLFDTSVLIEFDRGNHEVIKRIQELTAAHQTPAQITFINYAEFIEGIQRRSAAHKSYSLDFLNRFGILTTSRKTAEILAGLKEDSRKLKTGLVLADLIIASHAVEHGMLLVTRDKDFTKIPNLQYALV